MSKTYQVKSQWFQKRDKYGHQYSSWCKKVDDEELLCTVCDRKISCTRKGFAALKQHASTALHIENASIKLCKSQLLLKPRDDQKVPDNVPIPLLYSKSVPIDTNDVSPAITMQLCNPKEAVTKAELIWALKSVQCNMAASTVDDLNSVFSAMFPSSALAKDFCLGRTKLSYLITEALGPYFQKTLLYDVKRSYYTLHFDETTNNADKKELQFMVRYWSEEEKEIVCKHLQTVFIAHATSTDLVREIKKVLDFSNLSISKFVMLESDGPNVNKKVWNTLNSFLIKERGHGLLDIGTCNLHVLYNAFLKGLLEFGDEACELATEVFYFFKKFPSRWEDFESVQSKKNLPKLKFLKHVSNRWLTAGPACQRLLDQWSAIEDYFISFIPNNSKAVMKSARYKSIVKCLKCADIKPELLFVIESSNIFSSFTAFFQREEPLIHVLQTELDGLLIKLTTRISKSGTDPRSIILLENLLKATDVECSTEMANVLKTLNENDKLCVLRKIQRHFMASHNYLVQKNDFLKNRILSYCKCLQLGEITSSKSVKLIGELAKSLNVISLNPQDIQDEWRVLQSEIIIPEKYVRIDHFWRDIFDQKNGLGEPKYPLLNQLVKLTLCLAHGNADVERGFSVSRNILSEDKTRMSERVLNYRMLIKDALKKYKNVADVPITKELLKLAYGAYKSYENYLENQKRMEMQALKDRKELEKKIEEEKKKKVEIQSKQESIKKFEAKAMILNREKKETQESVDSLLKEANNRLVQAIKTNDKASIRLAQGMLEGAEKLREREKNCEEKEKKLMALVNKRKSSLIDAFILKKPKTI